MSARLTADLHGHGFTPADAASRATLVAQALGGFRRHTSADPAWAWFVPGRIEVFGKHTDYAGGHSLVAAVPRGFAIVARPTDDRRVRVFDARWQDAVEFDIDDEARTFTGWTNYIAVVARRFAKNFPGAALGVDLAIASDLPRAAGVSSSSALVVGVATALARRGQLSERPEWRAAIATPLDLAGYLGATENGLTFKSLAGTSGVGTHGGSEDHTAILTCRPGRVSAYSYVPVRHVRDATMPADWRFVIASSGVQADKAGSAKDRYNRASLATRALLGVWNDRSGRGPAATLAAALASGTDAEVVFEQILERGGHDGFGADDLNTRLAHFIGEDSRVLRALDAFDQADVRAIGTIATASQHDADVLLGNQIHETRTLAKVARDEGAFASSSFGAGFGGSVWALVRADESDAFGARWIDAYRRLCHPPGPIDAFVSTPGPGAVEIPLS
jgi:galactokinase